MKVLLALIAVPEIRKPMDGVRIPILAPPMTLPLLDEICRRAGFATELLDTRFHMRAEDGAWVFDEAGFVARIAASEAEVVALSFLSSSAKDAVRIAGRCRAMGKTVLGGGLHVTVAGEEVARTGAFDYLVPGDGELALPRLLGELAAGSRSLHPPETVLLPAETLRDLSEVPPITDLSIYGPVYDQFAIRTMYVETSRGCFKDCTFCEIAKTALGHHPLRRLPLEPLFAGLPALVERHGINYLLVADSIATAIKPHFLAFVAWLRATFGDRLSLQLNSTVDRWDDDIAAALAGLRCSVWFGFESGSQRVLDRIVRKGATVEQAFRAAESCRRHGVGCAFNVLLGLPGEEESDLEQTLKVFTDCPWIYPNPNIFHPLPGTALYRQCREGGLLRDPGDTAILDAEEIRARGAGPVLGVDYERVLRYRDRLMELQGERSI